MWDNENYEARAQNDSSTEDELLKTRQRCHTRNRIDQHPEVMSPTVHFLQMPLMKRKFFRVGRSKHHPIRRGHGPLFLIEVY
jgi:hypothetical protein